MNSMEAELVAAVKASAAMPMEKAWCSEVTSEVYVDSSSKLAVTARKGAKLRQIKESCLWMQEKQAYQKVAATTSSNDAVTQYRWMDVTQGGSDAGFAVSALPCACAVQLWIGGDRQRRDIKTCSI